jgi:hypothetical protein
MLLVVPVSKFEFEKPLNILGFIKSLRHFGPYLNHELLVVSRPSESAFANSVFDLIKDLFPSQFVKIHLFEEDGESGWPAGPNFYWKQTIEFLKETNNKSPWFWMELDVIPLKYKWLDSLEEEYYKCGKPFLGTIQDTNTVTKDNQKINIAKHLQGTAIYPPKIEEFCSIWEYVDKIDIAFDVICQWEIVPLTHDSKLIQQGFRTFNYKIEQNPFCIRGEDNGDFNGVVKYNDPIRSEAVVHHGCKDISLSNIVTSAQYEYLLNVEQKNLTC